MRRFTPRAALLTALGLGALVLPLAVSGGCGGREGDPPPSIDRTAWKPTFDAAMDALMDPDRRALLRVLSPDGRVALDQDLRVFGEMLAHPIEGPRTLAKLRARWPEVPDALIASARGGNIDDAWRLWMRAQTPPGVRPQQAGMLVEKGNPERMRLLYRYGEGPGGELGIELRRIRGQWFVDKIALGSPPR
jgi:hypothetical protein